MEVNQEIEINDVTLKVHGDHRQNNVPVSLALRIGTRDGKETADGARTFLKHSDVTKTIAEYVTSHTFTSPENLAEDVAKITIVGFQTTWVEVRVSVVEERQQSIHYPGTINIRRTRGDFPRPIVFISLGSNICPDKNLTNAVRLLRERTTVVAVSKVFITPPQLDTNQPPYHNMAVKILTPGDPYDLKRALYDIEDKLLRVRDPLRKNGPHTIDLDISFWDDVTFSFTAFNRDALGTSGKTTLSDHTKVKSGIKLQQIPHPDTLKFAHTIVPLADLDPDFKHPVVMKTLAEVAMEVTGHVDFKGVFETADFKIYD
ncbi:folic acid synthesis protein fol1-like [Lingula anatina]|uniref:2-amino-4-hydroxy-6-hydroxymethyldihydropteridine diphosphokinase n=1 Tax=Lingula anatina TaxID=7574 RepID=A0A1S3ITK1_LINAN|nr:folic acid synthesis protein fol1-like [Lingula anatina]|eukprot:XP_013400859.1 folic acid synthesis protein fol1-like [Lingula anatina]